MRLFLVVALLAVAAGMAADRLEGSIGDYTLTQCVLHKTGLWSTPTTLSPLSPAAPGDKVNIAQVKGTMTRITTPTIFPKALWILSTALGECVSAETQARHFDKHKKVDFKPPVAKEEGETMHRSMDEPTGDENTEREAEKEMKAKADEKLTNLRFGNLHILSALRKDYSLDEPELEIRKEENKEEGKKKEEKKKEEKKGEKEEKKKEEKKQEKGEKKKKEEKKGEKEEKKEEKKGEKNEGEKKEEKKDKEKQKDLGDVESAEKWVSDTAMESAGAVLRKKHKTPKKMTKAKETKKGLDFAAEKESKKDDYGFNFGPKTIESPHQKIRRLRKELKKLRAEALKCPIEEGNACFGRLHERVKELAERLTELCSKDLVCAGKLRARRMMQKLDQAELKERRKVELRRKAERDARRAEKREERRRKEEERRRREAKKRAEEKAREERRRELRAAAKRRMRELKEKKEREERERKERREQRKKRREERKKRREERRQKKIREAAREKALREKELEEAQEQAKMHAEEKEEAYNVAAQAHKEAEEQEKKFQKEQEEEAAEKAEEARRIELSIQDLTRTYKSVKHVPTVDPNAPAPGMVFCVAAGTNVYSSPTSMEGSMSTVASENPYRISEIVPGISHQFARVYDCMAYDYRTEYVQVDKLYKCPALENTGRCEL